LLSGNRKHLTKSADYFLGLKFGGALNETNLLTLLKQIKKPGLYEIMCHPGYYREKELARWRYWGYNWQSELEGLLSPRVKEFIINNNLVLHSRQSS
jgi:predicted glycoside hydrolase/deacetylase ChbG (UPF0249 family)